MSGNTATVSSELLDAVKNYLDITWEDAAGDEKLRGIIARGVVYIDSHAGETCDYGEEGDARGLLFDYCRYVRSDALNEFEANYLHELTALGLLCKARRAAEENTDV